MLTDPGCAEQTAGVQRCHWYLNGGSPATRPLHVPVVVPSARPTRGVPLTTGRTVFTGGAAVIGPSALEKAESLPAGVGHPRADAKADVGGAQHVGAFQMPPGPVCSSRS